MNQGFVDQSLAGQKEADKDSVEVQSSDLPLHCPMPGATLWDSHPRVFLPVEETGIAKCPYCGTKYKLIKP